MEFQWNRPLELPWKNSSVKPRLSSLRPSRFDRIETNENGSLPCPMMRVKNTENSPLNDRPLRNFHRFSTVSIPPRIDKRPSSPSASENTGSGYDQTVDKYRRGVPRRRWTGSLAALTYPVIIRQLESKDACFDALEGVGRYGWRFGGMSFHCSLLDDYRYCYPCNRR